MGARGKREAFSKRLWKTPLHVCTCSQPFPKRLSRPEFPAFSHNRGSVHRPCPRNTNQIPRNDRRTTVFITSRGFRITGVLSGFDRLVFPRNPTPHFLYGRHG